MFYRKYKKSSNYVMSGFHDNCFIELGRVNLASFLILLGNYQ